MPLFLGGRRALRSSAAVVSGDFSPSDMSEALHWYDASDEATITGSPTVTALADKVGVLNLDTIGTGPTTGTGGSDINGLNTIECGGAGCMQLNNINPFYNDFVIFFVGSIDVVDSTEDGIMAIQEASTENVNWKSNNASAFNGRVTGTGVTSYNNSGGPYSGVHIFELRANTTTADVETFVDDSADGSSLTGWTGPFDGNCDLWFLRGNNGAYLEGRFCEAVITDSVPADRASLITYLSDKWGTP